MKRQKWQERSSLLPNQPLRLTAAAANPGVRR